MPAVCARAKACPEEGCPAPLPAPRLRRLVRAHGPGPWRETDHFPSGDASWRPLDLSRARIAPQILGPDLFITMHTDCHHLPIRQTAAAARRVDPAAYLEGFAADARINDLRGVGTIAEDTRPKPPDGAPTPHPAQPVPLPLVGRG